MNDKMIDLTYKLINEQIDTVHLLAIIYDYDEEMYNVLKENIKKAYKILREV